MRKVFIEGYDHDISQMFKDEGWQTVGSIFNADLVCLEGGADVSPEIYSEENTDSFPHEEKDYNSFGLFFLAKKLGIPVVGICRGSQVLNVALGGYMDQHIEGHCKTHVIRVREVDVEVVCGHHQRNRMPNKVLDQIDGNKELYYADDGVLEIFIYNSERVMGFQPHPEWSPKGHESRALFFLLLEDILHDGV